MQRGRAAQRGPGVGQHRASSPEAGRRQPAASWRRCGKEPLEETRAMATVPQLIRGVEAVSGSHFGCETTLNSAGPGGSRWHHPQKPSRGDAGDMSRQDGIWPVPAKTRRASPCPRRAGDGSWRAGWPREPF